MLFPSTSSNSFAGRRLEAYRAGMIPKIFNGVYVYSTKITLFSIFLILDNELISFAIQAFQYNEKNTHSYFRYAASIICCSSVRRGIYPA